METNRFETFFDAVIAIIITVLILKIQQPSEPTLSAIWNMRISYVAYMISFLTLFNIWHYNHILFQKIDYIDNKVVWIYGVMTFIISLFPYFTMWVAQNINSIAAETMFGLLFVSTNFLYVLSIKAIHKSNPYNKYLQETDNILYQLTPLIVIILGFILTYTLYKPGIYFGCLIAVVLWIFIGWKEAPDED